MSDDRQNKSALRYVLAAAATTAAAAALYLASAYVGWLRVVFDALGDDANPLVRFFYRRGDMAGDPGLWLRYAVCFAIPAVFWAVALARLAPRPALRLAGVIVQRWFISLLVVAAAVGVTYAGARVLGAAPLDADESAFVFQSKIFCRGKLAAPAPPTEGDAAHAFFRAETDVVRGGRWFSSYPPLHPALLCLGAKVGWPKLVGVATAVLILISTYAIGRRALGAFGGAVAAVLAATSPAFIFTQASYLSEATFLCFFALALWGWLRAAECPSAGAMAALGAAAGAAFLTSEYAALYLALPLGWYLWRRLRTRAGRGNRTLWLFAGAAPFFALWVLYNWRQTGNFFLPPRFFADAAFFGFDESYNMRAALSSCARNLTALSVVGFGWPMVCLVPAAARLFLKPRPNDFEKALYAAAALTILAHLPLRHEEMVFAARYYYPAWFCLVFITARFFVILGASAQGRFARAGEGLAALVLAALLAVNFLLYMPRAAARYEGRPGGNDARWADADVRRAVAAVGIDAAVVIIRPREWCLSSAPGSPFLDDAVVYARDNGSRNGELKKIFPGRAIYLLDYAYFGRTGEIEAQDFDVER